MGHEDILRFLKETGYATRDQIKAHFADQDSELIDMNMTYLIENQIVKKAKFASSSGEGILFYVLPK